MRATLSRVWNLLHEPRAVTAITATAWIIVLAIGLVALIDPPQTVERDWGSTVTLVWSVLLLTGGSAGLAGCLSGWWWVERIGIMAVTTGSAMYLSTILMLHFTGHGNRLAQAGYVVLAIAGFGTRWLRIRGLQHDPGRPI